MPCKQPPTAAASVNNQHCTVAEEFFINGLYYCCHIILYGISHRSSTIPCIKVIIIDIYTHLCQVIFGDTLHPLSILLLKNKIKHF